MERSLGHGIVVTIVAGLMAFAGSLLGVVFQSYLTGKQEKLAEKRAVYSKVMGKLGILPLNQQLMLRFSLSPAQQKLFGLDFRPKIDLSDLKRQGQTLKDLTPEKLLDIREVVSSATLMAGPKLSLKLTELMVILEQPTGILANPKNPNHREKLIDLYKEMLELMKEEVSG